MKRVKELAKEESKIHIRCISQMEMDSILIQKRLEQISHKELEKTMIKEHLALLKYLVVILTDSTNCRTIYLVEMDFKWKKCLQWTTPLKN